MLRNIA